MQHGVLCLFRHPRWRSEYDPETHRVHWVCVRCGHTRVTTSDTIDNIWGEPGGGGRSRIEGDGLD